MENYLWMFWVILAVIFVVAETFTLGFVLLWFGIGAAVAALVAMLGGSLLLQFFVFAVISVILTGLSRTIFSKYLIHRPGDGPRIGIDALPGQVGTVTHASRGALREAAVKVYGTVWTAFPEDGETEFEEGEKVEVIRVQGSSIIVRRAEKSIPDWRGD
ncbi:MAG: NfeD family protein [Blastocatellia bacterium]